MSERVIAKKSVSGYIYEPDPNAPSVSEIVEVLQAAENKLAEYNIERGVGRSIAHVLARLEDT